MGGSGSGRYADTYDNTVEECLDMDISMMIRRKWVTPGFRSYGTLKWTRIGREIGSISHETHMDLDPAYIRLHYTWHKTDNLDYEVFLTKTYPNFGGFRYWFRCPSCVKRVRKLYCAPGSRYFLCRICQNLTYTSCRDSHQFDALFAHIAANTGFTPEQVKKALNSI